ncbi:hypothetical protein BASA62_004182 [Batrachochytrium salamandrivorans]|nr:hypothetical protein BASA62_004182 [Batrachochytrium salamandrivorans]
MKPISFVAISFLAITVSAWSPWDNPYHNLPTSQSTATQSPQHSGQDKVEAEITRLTAAYEKERDSVAPTEAKYKSDKQNAMDARDRMNSIVAKLEETDIDDDERLELEKIFLREQIDHIPKEIEDLLAEWERIKADKRLSKDSLKTWKAEIMIGYGIAKNSVKL